MSTYESFPSARIETVPSPEQLTVTYVDISDAVEKNAIDTAEAKLTADKEELNGFKGWCTKVFKFNLFYDLYRRQEIEKAKRKIAKSGNIYTGTGADIESTGRAKEQILQRFTSEYEEEMIQKNAGEWKEKAGDSEKEKTFRENIHALIQDFVSGAIDETQLEEEKNRLLSNLTGVAQGDIRVRFADNVIQIARHMKAAHDHGAGCARLDMDIVRGKAVTGVRTEIQNKFDKTVDDFKKTRIGSLVGGLVNETTVSTAVVAALSLSGAIAKSGAYMAARGLGAFAGTALLGGVLAWGRRRTQLEQERKQHAREMAQGKTFDKDKHERRKQVEEYRQKTVDAMTVVQELKTALYTSEGGREIARDLTEEEMKTAIGILAHIEARDRLSNEKKADLLSYSHVSRVEEERTTLLIAKAKAKIELSRMLKKYHPDESFDDVLNAAVDTAKESLAGEMNERDKLFKEFKGKESLHAAFAGVMTGLAVGVATQEVLAFLRSDQSGLTESAVKWLGEKLRAFGVAHAAPSAGIPSPEAALHNQTMLNWLWHQGAQKFGWEHPPVLHEELVRTAGKGMATLKLPEGLRSLHNPDGTVSIVQGTKHIVDNLKFNASGQLTEESKKLLAAQHIGAQETVLHTTERVTEKVKHTVSEYVARHGDAFHKIKRLLWYNNDTPGVFDKNELKLWLGGTNGTGIDGRGNFVFNIRHMRPDGSYVKGFSVDAQDAMKRGALKMLFSVSRDTQNMVVEIPIGPNGNAVIPQNSEIAHLLFKSVGGRAQFLGKFAEVAEVRGQKDGADLVRILATHVGKGLKETAGTIVKDIPHATPITTFDIPPVFELPPPIPIVGRRPLEPSINRPSPEEPPHLPMYYGAYEKGGFFMKRHFTDLHLYRNSREHIEILAAQLSGDKRYARLLQRMEALKKFPNVSKIEKEKLEKDLERHKARYEHPRISLSEYIGKELDRAQRQVENIVIENAAVGEKPFLPEFYEHSPLVKGIERADEVVLIFNPPLGDSILTVPVIHALDEYFKQNGMDDKKIVLIATQKDLLSGVEDQFAGRVTIIRPEEAPGYFRKAGKKERFIINSHRNFEDYDIFDFSEKEIRDPSRVMSVDWANWLKEEVPLSDQMMKKYDPLPARILRNFEVMFGQKLFDDINTIDHFLEKDADFETKESALKKKYNILDHEIPIVITTGSSVMPKEYHPDRWKEVVRGMFGKNPNTHILLVVALDPARSKNYIDMARDLASEGYIISLVDEPLSNMSTLMGLARAVITPDTGLGHLASALGTPNVMLTLCDPVQWSAARTIRVTHPKAIESYKTERGTYDLAWRTPDQYYTEEGVGASDIEPAQVIQAVDKALAIRRP